MNGSLVAYYKSADVMTVTTMIRYTGETDDELRIRFEKYKADMEKRKDLKFFLNRLDVARNTWGELYITESNVHDQIMSLTRIIV